MKIDCGVRKCLKFVNPEEYPGVFSGGEPWVYDENYGACVDCQRQFEDEQERINALEKSEMPKV